MGHLGVDCDEKIKLARDELEESSVGNPVPTHVGNSEDVVAGEGLFQPSVNTLV